MAEQATGETIADRENKWVCPYCCSIYAEYVNGCPRCHLGEPGTATSVRRLRDVLAAAEERDRLRERLRELCEDAAVFEAMMAGRGDVVTDVTARELRREITLTRVALNGGAANG